MPEQITLKRAVFLISRDKITQYSANGTSDSRINFMRQGEPIGWGKAVRTFIISKLGSIYICRGVMVVNIYERLERVV